MWLFSPMRMTEPLPKCLSIWLVAISRALSRSTAGFPSVDAGAFDVVARRLVDEASPYGGGVTITSAVQSITLLKFQDGSSERTFGQGPTAPPTTLRLLPWRA